jgi:hypothetical protein
MMLSDMVGVIALGLEHADELQPILELLTERCPIVIKVIEDAELKHLVKNRIRTMAGSLLLMPYQVLSTGANALGFRPIAYPKPKWGHSSERICARYERSSGTDLHHHNEGI